MNKIKSKSVPEGVSGRGHKCVTVTLLLLICFDREAGVPSALLSSRFVSSRLMSVMALILDTYIVA